LKGGRVSFIPCEELPYQVVQALEVNRLGQVAVEAGVEGGLAEAVRVEGRERDDGHALKLRLLAYAARGGEAVLLRHGDVHQDQVGARELSHAQRVGPVRRRDDAVAHVLTRE